MKPSHTIETTVEAWEAIEEAPAVRALFIEGRPWMPWTGCGKALVRILDSNALAAAHVVPELGRGRPERVRDALQRIAVECDRIADGRD